MSPNKISHIRAFTHFFLQKLAKVLFIGKNNFYYVKKYDYVKLVLSIIIRLPTQIHLLLFETNFSNRSANLKKYWHYEKYFPFLP